MMNDNPPTDEMTLLERYRQVVLAYESVGNEITALLEANGGGTQRMSDEEYLRYREMASRRDVLYDTLKHLEVRLLGDEA
jgi:hypothetical protein